MSDNAVIYWHPGIIDNHRLSFIKVSPIIDNEMIADSHHYCHLAMVLDNRDESWLILVLVFIE